MQKMVRELLTRGVNEVIDYARLEKCLLGGEKLRVKFGIDPTAPLIHLGRAVPLLKLRDFQRLGHQVVLVIGDFTGVIGDTSDKESERPMLSETEVKKNMETYVLQAGKILDIKQAEIHYNSKWLEKLGYAEVGRQADQFSLAEFIDRDNIRRRLDAGRRVSLREVLYPLMQGYDSVAVKADVEIGGTDQRFNLLAGRKLQAHYRQPAQDILLTNLILAPDGRKMSASWGNTINVSDPPAEMFGKVMSLPDSALESYFEHCTRAPLRRLSGRHHPRDLKMELAFEIVKIYWGETGAAAARDGFVAVFREKKTPAELPELPLAGKDIVTVLLLGQLAKSKSDARRLIRQGSVRVDGEVIVSPETTPPAGSVVQKGKRHFVRII